jgi:hypothetical protein
MLVKCPWRAVILYQDLLRDHDTKAADTGSMVHTGVQHWHQLQDVTLALETLRASIERFPLGDVAEAEKQFHAYTEDPRNQQAEIVLLETQVAFALAPAETDPTGRMIYVQGTLDQVRREHGILKLYDVKTSTREGINLVNDYSYQIAAYCYGAAQVLGCRVAPGALICTRGYRKRGVDPRAAPPGVFFHFAWSYDDCEAILDGVREVVAAIRSGRVWLGPGDHCAFHCPAAGVDSCLPLLRKVCA